jgi:hypothetical protein
MARIRVALENREPRRLIELDPTETPFHRDRMPELMPNPGHRFIFGHACGGKSASSTPHVVATRRLREPVKAVAPEDHLVGKTPTVSAVSPPAYQSAAEDPTETVRVAPCYTGNSVSERRRATQ